MRRKSSVAREARYGASWPIGSPDARGGGSQERRGDSSTWLPFYFVLLAVLAAGCSSPNRGRWEGTFDGGVSGTMHFEVNTRGTRAEGRIVGTTSQGQDFRAEFEGTLNQDYLRAAFGGSAESGLGIGAGFEGELSGTLADGRGEGKWSAELVRGRTGWRGRWQADQVAP